MDVSFPPDEPLGEADGRLVIWFGSFDGSPHHEAAYVIFSLPTIALDRQCSVPELLDVA
jgi:hypothetical protein